MCVEPYYNFMNNKLLPSKRDLNESIYGITKEINRRTNYITNVISKVRSKKYVGVGVIKKSLQLRKEIIKLKAIKKDVLRILQVIIMDRYQKMLLRLPIACDWVIYEGEDCVAQINYEATVKAGKPMVDISYCMTRALNQVILKTVQWDRRKFKPSKLGMTIF